VVIVSAHAGVTDALVELGARAPRGGTDTGAVEELHRRILRDLALPEDLLEPLMTELRNLVRGMRLVGEASPRTVDHLLSFGERFSARTVAAFLTGDGVKATAVDSFDLGFRTDSRFGRARPLPDEGRIPDGLASVPGVPIVTGFIAMDELGNITTLGRNGSDYSAALFGKAVGAEEIQMWKGVDGVMTADPEMVSNPRPIEVMGFDEASELAYFGWVLHPATILPAMESSIPVRILNFSRPEGAGTVILPTYEEQGVAVRAIVHKRDMNLLTLLSPRMLAQHGFLAKVFEAAARHEVDVDLVSTSEVSITMTIPGSEGVEALTADLEKIGEVSLARDHAMISVVGHGILLQTGVASQVLAALADAEVRVRAISQGAVKVNVGLVVAEVDLPRAVVALHERFFPVNSTPCP
jgi:aspartate kinase